MAIAAFYAGVVNEICEKNIVSPCKVTLSYFLKPHLILDVCLEPQVKAFVF